MTFEYMLFLIGFSFCHVFFPGHPTPLLLATGGMGLRNAWKFTLGMAIAHGLVMAAALAVGQVALGLITSVWPSGRFYLTHIDIPIFFILGLVLLREAFHTGKEKDKAAAMLNPQRPFLTGAAIGSIPCPDTIGYAMIGGALGVHGIAHTLAATSLVFAGTALGFCSVTAVIGFVPKLVSSPKLSTVVCLVTAVTCFANVTWRVWNTWNDWA